MVAEREGIEPTKPEVGFNGFEDRGDHQAHITLRDETGRDSRWRQINRVNLPILLSDRR